jgi:hypothetical protein
MAAEASGEVVNENATLKLLLTLALLLSSSIVVAAVTAVARGEEALLTLSDMDEWRAIRCLPLGDVITRNDNNNNY